MAMDIVSQEYRDADPNQLVPHPENPRQGDVGAIHTSIEANGFYGAIIVQKSSQRVLAGNHRLIAARQAGAATVPVIEVDVDDKTARRILLADNRTNDLATYDTTALTDLLRQLHADDDLLGTGYDGDDLDELLKQWDSDMPGAESPVPASSEGKLTVTFDEALRDEVRDVLTNAIAASGLPGVEVA